MHVLPPAQRGRGMGRSRLLPQDMPEVRIHQHVDFRATVCTRKQI